MSSGSKKIIVIVVVAGVIFTVILFQARSTAWKNTQGGACIAARTQMQGAKWAWAQDNHKATNDVPTDSDLFGPNAYIISKPECPAEGIYTLRKVGEPVQCSIRKHTIPAPK